VSPDAVAGLVEGMGRTGWTVVDLWLGAIALGSALSQGAIEHALDGSGDLGDHEYDLLAHALNEELGDLGHERSVGYSSRS
jgi:hypothetical protein